MTAYLIANPPARRQFKERGMDPSGLIVVHTAESVLDTVGPDTGAEAVARFIQGRTEPGCYHTLVDSDSIVRLVPYDLQTYGDGTGSNPFAIHISAACAAADWPRMSAEQRDAFVDNLALAAADAAEWLRTEHGITVPAARITLAASDALRPGFIPHGDRDPGRRSDPGTGFPWATFLSIYDLTTRQENDPMADPKIVAQLDRIEADGKAARKAAEAAAKDAKRAREGSYKRDRALIEAARTTADDVDTILERVK